MLTDYTQCLSQGTARATFDELPPALHLSVLLALPRLVDRVRCALVAKRWAALLSDPAFWAELNFDGANHALSDDELRGLFGRAAGKLRSLDLSDRMCFQITSLEPILIAMAAEGLTRNLESLVCTRWDQFILSLGSLRPVLAACPRLKAATVNVDGANWRSAVEVLKTVCVGGKGSSLVLRPVAANDSLVEFATAIADALSRSRIESITFSETYDDDAGDFGDEATTFNSLRVASQDWPAAEAAAARLAAALADPIRGPRKIETSSDAERRMPDAVPAFMPLCRALTSASPLRSLQIGGHSVDGAHVAALAAALASGASRLETLEVSCCNLSFGAGCARPLLCLLRCKRTETELCAALTADAERSAPLAAPRSRLPRRGLALASALAVNDSLTDLRLSACTLGDGAYAAIAEALLRNRTLRTLHLDCIGESLAPLFAALGGRTSVVTAAPAAAAAAGNHAGGEADTGLCAIRELRLEGFSLDVAAAAELGCSMCRGAGLEELTVESFSPAAGRAPDHPHAEGLAFTIGKSLNSLGDAARLRKLSFTGVPIGDQGAPLLPRRWGAAQ